MQFQSFVSVDAARAGAISFVCLLLSSSGCSSEPADQQLEVVPVAGKISVEGSPLTTGNLEYLAIDPGQTRSQPRSVGAIQPDGSYQMQTAGFDGVPPGKYKVVIYAPAEPPTIALPGSPQAAKNLTDIKWLVNKKYGNANTSDLVIDVVESPPPNAYDVNVKK
jgi:hypothetical protein